MHRAKGVPIEVPNSTDEPQASVGLYARRGYWLEVEHPESAAVAWELAAHDLRLGKEILEDAIHGHSDAEE